MLPRNGWPGTWLGLCLGFGLGLRMGFGLGLGVRARTRARVGVRARVRARARGSEGVGSHRLRAVDDLHAAQRAPPHIMHVRHRIRLRRQGAWHLRTTRLLHVSARHIHGTCVLVTVHARRGRGTLWRHVSMGGMPAWRSARSASAPRCPAHHAWRASWRRRRRPRSRPSPPRSGAALRSSSSSTRYAAPGARSAARKPPGQAAPPPPW